MELEDFLDELFKEQTGYVYAPVKGRRWSQFFFEWPPQKESLAKHLILQSDLGHEAYLSPSLFTDKRIAPTTFKGTYHVWAEFDKQVPDSPDLEPTIRIQSGTPGHEHWYWHLDRFETNVQVIRDITKRLTYHYGADLSGWNYEQVLRPPGTSNNKHKIRNLVKVAATSPKTYTRQDFSIIPEPPRTAHTTIDKKKLRPLQELIAKYIWTDDAIELLNKTVHQPGRSSALTRLAFSCLEAGMSNEEIFVVLDDADKRWRKFTDRTDRETKLAAIISYVRSQKAITLDIIDECPVYRFSDFMNTEIELEWVIKDVFPVAGSGVIFGPSEVGKSTFMLRLAIALALGNREFLAWKIERRQRVLFTSMEMGHDEVKQFFRDMGISKELWSELQEWLFIWPIGHDYPLDVRDQQIEVVKYLDLFKPDLLIIDSLGAATYGSVKNSDDMKRLYSFLNQDVRQKRKCGYFFIHHPTKGKKEEGQAGVNDMYGDTYITNRAQSVINLTPAGKHTIEVNMVKSRLSMERRSFKIIRTNKRDYELSTLTKTQEEKLEQTLSEVPDILSLGS